jgi:hypothetical protein
MRGLLEFFKSLIPQPPNQEKTIAGRIKHPLKCNTNKNTHKGVSNSTLKKIPLHRESNQFNIF